MNPLVTWVCAALLGALCVAGCSSAGEGGALRPTGDRRSRLANPRRVELGVAAGPIAMDRDRIVFPMAAGKGDRWDVVASTASGRQQQVARSSFPHGLIYAAVPVGDWTVYVDQSALQTDAKMDVLWRIRAINADTHATKTLRSNGRHPDPFVPSLGSGQGAAVWTTAEKDRSARLSMWRPTWASPRDVLRRARLQPDTARLAGSSVTYVGAAVNETPGVDGSDCWKAGMGRSKPVPLTNTGRVIDCAVDGDAIVWTSHIDPHTQNPPDTGVNANPYELWARQGNGRARLLHQGYFSEYPFWVAHGLVAWVDLDDNVIVSRMSDGKQILHLPQASPAIVPVTGDGDTVAVVSGTGSETSVELYDVKR